MAGEISPQIQKIFKLFPSLPEFVINELLSGNYKSINIGPNGFSYDFGDNAVSDKRTVTINTDGSVKITAGGRTSTIDQSQLKPVGEVIPGVQQEQQARQENVKELRESVGKEEERNEQNVVIPESQPKNTQQPQQVAQTQQTQPAQTVQPVQQHQRHIQTGLPIQPTQAQVSGQVMQPGQQTQHKPASTPSPTPAQNETPNVETTQPQNTETTNEGGSTPVSTQETQQETATASESGANQSAVANNGGNVNVGNTTQSNNGNTGFGTGTLSAGGFGNTGGGFQSNIAPTETFQNASDKAQEITANLATPATPATATATNEQETGSADWVQNFLDQNLESPEEKKKRERREATNSVIYGIGDAASAIGNLYATTKYAPNGYDAKNSMSVANQARVDKATAERNAMRDWYLNYALNMNKLQNGERAWKRQQEQDVQAQKNFETQMEHKKSVEENKEDRFNQNLMYKYLQLEEKARQFGLTYQQKQEFKALDNEIQKRKLDIQAYRANVYASNAGGSGSRSVTTVDLGNGETVGLSKNNYNKSMLSDAYKKIDKKHKLTDNYGQEKQNPAREDMIRAITEYCLDESIDNEEREKVRKLIRKIGNTSGGSSSSQGNGGSSNGREHAGVRS